MLYHNEGTTVKATEDQLVEKASSFKSRLNVNKKTLRNDV